MSQVIADQEFNLNAHGAMDPNDKCIPKFFYKEKYMDAKSKEEGRPIYDQDTMVEILIPGKMAPVTRKMIDADKERWPIQWFKFQKMGETKIEGTPIEQFPQLTVAQVGVLKSINVLSIESLASLGDEHMIKLGPDGRMLKAKAERFIAAAKDSALVEKQAKRIDELEKSIEELKALIPKDNVMPLEKPKRKYTKKATA